MKIGLLVPGGVDRSGTHRVVPFLLWLVERLAREHEVHVFALRQERQAGRWELLGAQVHNVGPRPRRLRALALVTAEHRRSRFDVLHALWAIPQGVVGAAARGLLGCPLLLSLAGGELVSMPAIDYGGSRNARGRAWLRIALAAADRVTAPSRAMVAELERGGHDARLVPLGVALDAWPPRPPRRRRPGEPMRLLHVADLSPVKDQVTLLGAVRRLADEGVDFTLDVVGSDQTAGRVPGLASRAGLGSRVRFRGHLPQSTLRDVVVGADLLVVSSRHEAGPVVVLEAGAEGVPTVGTAVGYVAEWAPDAAIAVPVGDQVALASAIQALVLDEERRLALAEAAHARALAQDADRMASAYADLYEELAGHRARPGPLDPRGTAGSRGAAGDDRGRALPGTGG